MKIAPLLLLLALVACTYNPVYTGIECGQSGSCPSGYTCIQDRCYPQHEETSSEEPADEVAQDGDAGDDAGQDAGDQVSDGDQAGDDGGLDGDGTSDDASPDGGDEDPCGGCPPQQYCDTSVEPAVCRRCEDPSHCGIDCQPCAPGDGCINRNGTFCCFPPCDESNLCELRLACGGRDYVCRAFFNPLRYEWNPVELNPPHWCRLSDSEAPLPETGCKDANTLLYHCPWDGICSGGQCVPNPTVERTYACGTQFGCEGDLQEGHCRLYRKNGLSCEFNFDCDSFCCSRDNAAVCIAYDQSLCKIHTTLYWEDLVNLYTFIAQGVSDNHNMNEWTFQGGEHGTKCTNDASCDSGHCRHFAVAGENRCDFDGCVNTPEANDIKATYFCRVGDHDAHLLFVTNQNPLPPPDSCQ